MLARSSSTPIPTSWIPSHSHESSPEFDHHHHLRTSKLNSICLLELPKRSSITKVRSETDLKEHKRSSVGTRRNLDGFVSEEEEEVGYSARDRLFSSSGLGEMVVEEDGVGGGIGRNIGSGRFNGDGFGDGDTSADAYYQKLIEQDPGNGLVLGNYAKFLKEVRKDVVKAEEYCERAILTNPNDGKVVALYAELIWEVHRDTSRAEKYFDQAVQLEPNDCYVMASYARFLWDAEETEEEKEVEKEDDKMEEEIKAFESCRKLSAKPPPLYQGVNFPGSLLTNLTLEVEEYQL